MSDNVKKLSKHDEIVILAYKLGFSFDFETCEIIRPSGHRRKIDKIYGQQRYPFDGFTYEGKNFSFKVHRLCAYIKFGDEVFKDGVLVRHLDDNPLNLSWDNLVLGTPQDNARDILKTDRVSRAKHARSFQKRSSWCKTEDSLVEEILRDYFSTMKGLPKKPHGLVLQMAKKFDIAYNNMVDILLGRSFKDIYDKVSMEFNNV